MNGALPVQCTQCIFVLFFSAAMIIASASNAEAQRKVGPDRLAVDVVSVRKLGRLHGILLSQGSQTTKIAVRKAWLASKLPEFSTQHLEKEASLIKEGRQKILQRLDQWKTDRKGDGNEAVIQFVDQNIRTLALDKPFEPDKFTFTVIELDATQVRRVYSQSDERHVIAGIAWQEKLPDVEERSFAFLKREVETRKIDVANYDVNLTEQLPGMLDSDEEWEIRKAIIEFILLPRLEYHGIGTMFYRKSGSANPLAIMQQMMRGGGFSQLNDLGKDLGLPEFQDRRDDLDDNVWLERMIKTAESEDRRCFSVSSLSQGETVLVETIVYVKAADKKWYPLKRFEAKEKLASQNADAINRIKQDPQVERVLKVAKQMGLNDENILDKAMRGGAATRKALQDVSSELEAFLEPYSFDVDIPPVPSLMKQ